MPFLKGKLLTDAEAIALGFCPETGKILADIEDIEAHIAQLWPGAQSPEAVSRIAMIRDAVKSTA